MRGVLVFFVVLFVCTTGGRAEAANNCNSAPGKGSLYCCKKPGEEWEQKTIEIVTNINVGAICNAGSCTSPSANYPQANLDVRWQIRSLIEELNSAAGVDLHFTMGGETSASPGDEVENKIHIYSVQDCMSSVAGSANYDGDGGWWLWWWQDPWGRIAICNANANGALAWTPASFRRILIHELGHAIGMAHLEDCIPGEVADDAGTSVMNNTTGIHSHRDKPFLSYMRDIYGTKQGVATGKYSSSGASWSNTAPAPAEVNEVSTRFSATNSRSGSNVFLVERNGTKHIRLSSYNGNLWTSVGNLWHPNNAYSPGIASKSNSSIGLFFQSGYDIGDGQTDIRFSLTTNGGTSWAQPSLPTDLSAHQETTGVPGITATYDIETDKYVALWRADDLKVRYWVEGNIFPTTLDNVFSLDTPSIACGPIADVGVRNCLITWTNTSSWRPGVSWKQCRLVEELVSGGGFFDHTERRFSDCSATRFHGALTVGTASVAYTGPINPWQLALSQGGNTMFTWRKQGPDTASFTDERSFVNPSPNSTLPEVGSRDAATNRRYIFTGSR